MSIQEHYDVLIIGGGLAGLTLARQLLLETDKSVCIIDKSAELPVCRQKYGESTVQVGGYYLAKVLELEHYLFHEHFMKYNLRFCFKTDGRPNDSYEDYSQSYIRNFSNIPCFQIDRNRFEADLLKMNLRSSRFEVHLNVSSLEVELSSTGEVASSSDITDRSAGRVASDISLKAADFTIQDVRYRITSEWVIDATGRARVLARHNKKLAPSSIEHGAAFMWVDGTVDVERLTSLKACERRNSESRKSTGHLPQWLATNHFMGEGFWFWIIPLRSKTSLGLVFDQTVMDVSAVSSADLLRNWVSDNFPLLKNDLDSRKILDFNCLRSFSHDCSQTIDSSGWAITGEAGRFLDPLYSPGTDFIAFHNSLITEAIVSRDKRSRARKCWLYEQLMQSWFQSMLPSFSTSYNALGDQETFAIKYTWELSVYFAFMTFPFINDFHRDNVLIARYLSRLSRLGPINHGLQRLLRGYFNWKNNHRTGTARQLFYEFTQLEPLRRAEATFYKVGIDADQYRHVLDQQLAHLTELANFLVAWIYSIVLNDERVLNNAAFIADINYADLELEPEKMQQEWCQHKESKVPQEWTFDTTVLKQFHPA